MLCHRFQSLDRRKRMQDARLRAQSTGALNFGYLSEEGILRGGVGLFNYSTSSRDRDSRYGMARESQQSIGQFSDHVDKYRDVALWRNNINNNSNSHNNQRQSLQWYTPLTHNQKVVTSDQVFLSCRSNNNCNSSNSSNSSNGSNSSNNNNSHYN